MNHRSTCLHTAIENGSSTEFLEYLIARFPSCVTSPKSSDGSYALHTALAVADSPDEAMELVSLIMRHDDKAAQRRRFDGSVPLHIAATKSNCIEAADRILAVYPEALTMDACGVTPLEIAIMSENTILVQLFLAESRDPSSVCTPGLLHFCIIRQGAEQAKMSMVRSIVNTSFHLAKTYCEISNMLPLFASLSAPCQSANLVRFFLEVFPDAMNVSKNEMFPLHWAIYNKCRLPVVRTLLEYCESPTVLVQQPMDGYPSSHTALAMALNALDYTYSRFIGYDLDVISFMISKDPDALIRPFPDGGLLLHHCLAQQTAVTCPPAKVVSCLLTKYPDAIRHRDHCGRLPLHVIAMNAAEPSLISLLIEAYPGAVATRDNQGRLPIHHYTDRRTVAAAISSRREIYPNRAMLLLEGNLKTLLVADNDGYLPLHLACMRSSRSLLLCIEMFVDLCPMSILHTSPEGIPIFVAARHSSLDVIFMLAKRSPELFAKVSICLNR